ncbi:MULTISPECIES: tetratricopeptide repeat-containing sensor histidine kinase [unclassified Lentimicrobium]|uniref:tetratricopeptide repeat-containing sensor histidine kinase n=1 Tax=unclassified Lentimicrobium TaxID=2677434 RepID=UPI0015522907|nr:MULTISPECIES: tetratricopeptide repeat-containing sensor histidine kinase [unclassified Lentimicrobium]NPD46355.1 tetratricopeptide repeat-containing sensor histidine kinase [Lentimicrobium sp. S6]NPD85006.1 tetratricopeptide repeat-containing sensor histidine kinase [Lentimicrobium sp. L6]
MKKYIIVVLATFFSLNIIAQHTDNIPYVDSLLSVVEANSDPKTKIQAYSKLCWIERSRNPQMALDNGNRGLQEINNHPELDYLKPELLNYLGLVHRNKGDYSNAINYYFEALELATKYDNTIQIAYSNNNLGGIFTLKGDYLNAIKYLEKAFFNFKKIDDYKGLGYVCVNLGNLHRHNDDTKEAIEYFNQAVEYKNMVDDSVGIAILINLQAITYYDMGDYNKAYGLYRELEPLYINNKDEKGLAVIKNYLGLLEVRNKKYSEAIAYYKQAIAINEKIENKQGISTSLINLAYVYHKKGLKNDSFKSIDKGYGIAKQIGDKEEIAHAYEIYSIIYSELNDFKKAYSFQEKYTQAVISKNDYETKERLAALRINNELDKRAKKNKYLEEENENLNHENNEVKGSLIAYKYITIALLIILIGIGIYVFILLRKNREKITDNSALLLANEKLSEANQTRDKFLSIIGHDLKNPFNSVLGLTSLLSSEWDTIPNEEKKYIINEINTTSNTLYELMDNLLLWAKNQSNSIHVFPEEFNMNDYLVDMYELFRNQASYKNIKILMDIGEKNMVYADPNMISTVLRNLMSNAIKFTRKSGKISVELKQRNAELEFCISDNGKGLLPDDLKRILETKSSHTTKGTENETGTGLGLLLVKEFIRLNGGVFWVESKLDIGSKFYFTLPKKTKPRF